MTIPGFSLSTAERLFRGGRTADAEAACRLLLDAQPASVPVMRLLATVLDARGRPAEAEEVLRRALEASPRDPDLVRALGEVLHEQGRSDAAADAFAILAELASEDGTAWRCLGLALAAAERPDAALAAFDRALALLPGAARIHFERACVLAKLDRIVDALIGFDRATRLDPGWADAWYRLGMALVAIDHHEEAVPALERALAVDPGHEAAGFLLGQVLRDMGLTQAAVAVYMRMVKRNPANVEAHVALGNVGLRGHSYDEALLAYDHALSLVPDREDILVNKSYCLEMQGRFDDALAVEDRILALNPGNVQAKINRAQTLFAMGRCDAAFAALNAPDVQSSGRALCNLGLLHLFVGDDETALRLCRKAVAVDPDDAQSHFNLGNLLLMMGNYAEGFAEYEWRYLGPNPAVSPRRLGKPRWAGEPLEGKTLLVTVEQGIGDSVQMARFLPRAKSWGGRVVVEVLPAAVPLLRDVPGPDGILASGGSLPPFDLQIPVISLPHVLGVAREADFAVTGPYLFADPDLVAKWRDRLGPPDGRLRVGVAWAGNRVHGNDRNRSMPAAAMLDALARPGVSLFSLQKDKREGDERVLADRSDRVTDLAPDFADFRDTAAVMALLDLVVAVDTSVVHVAGALGRPTWLMLPFVPDWRWLLSREDTPWYPSLRLFRQGQEGEWAAPLARAAAELDRLAADRRDSSPGGTAAP